MNNFDYSLLKGRITLFACTLMVCTLLLWFSFSQISKQQRMMGSTQSEMNNAEEEINNLNNLVSLFENYNADYKKYETKGFLSEELRLSWIETLENTANSLGLHDLSYQISPRQQLSDKNLALPPNITLFESKLALESSLVHEGDLIELINSLNEVNSGIFIIDSCKIERSNQGIELASSNNFKASCSTSWYTASYNQQANDFMEGERW
jgi:hypothetical protein